MSLEARGLVKRFGDVTALDGLDLKIPGGELYGLVGPNGSGKTTLIRILMALDTPSRGEARVLGLRPGHRRADVGYMPQDDALYPDLSIRENLVFFAGLYGARYDAKARALLRFVRLWDERDRLVGELSGGMRRRASLVMALVHDPLVLFLDEPTVGVDPVLRNEFWDSFRARADAGASLLITTHHIEEARRCDRVGLLWRGRMLREGPPAQLLEEAGTENLEDAFIRFIGEQEAEA